MAFADDPLWEDGLTYSGLEIRRQDAMWLQSDGTAGGAVPGIRPGDIGLAVSVVGSTITVTAGVAALYKAGFGVYRVSNPSSWTGTLTAANATNPRIDLVYVRVWDNAEDSSGLFKADVVYLVGTAAPSPVAPTPGALEIYIPLATINVPQSGGGSPSVSSTVRAITVAPGGISPNAAQAGTYAGQYRDGATLQRYNGSTWEDKLYFATGGQVNFGASAGAGSLAAMLAATSTVGLSMRVSGDTQNRFQFTADGKHQWGPGGSTAPDTTLYRNSAGELKTDGAFTIGGVGRAVTVIKPGDTSRASTTTVTADPDLNLGALDPGTYLLDGYLIYNGAATGTGDLKMTVTPTGGTVSSSFYTLIGPALSGVTASQYTATAFTNGSNVGSNGSANNMGARLTGSFTLSVGVTALTIFWAQSTSSATATVLKAGSWIRATRIS